MGLRVRLTSSSRPTSNLAASAVVDAFDFTDVGWLGVERMTGCRGVRPMVVTILTGRVPKRCDAEARYRGPGAAHVRRLDYWLFSTNLGVGRPGDTPRALK